MVAYRAALEGWPREQEPLDWANRRPILAGCLRCSVDARRGRHGWRRRSSPIARRWRNGPGSVPLQWAATQNSIGDILYAIDLRESGTARLEQAVVAYRAALEEWPREQDPLNWALIQSNLGLALEALGDRENGTARLEQAVVAYRAALEAQNRERAPMHFAGVQTNLGDALSKLGERESGTARLEEAVDAYKTALEVWTREETPKQWAGTQNNLGSVLTTCGWAWGSATGKGD